MICTASTRARAHTHAHVPRREPTASWPLWPPLAADAGPARPSGSLRVHRGELLVLYLINYVAYTVFVSL